MSSSASLVATARERRNRRLASSKGQGQDRPPSPNSSPASSSHSLWRSAPHQSSNNSDRPPPSVVSIRTWDIDDAPRPRLSPRNQPSQASSSAASDVEARNVSTLLKLPDELLHDNAASSQKKEHLQNPAGVSLRPRWARHVIPPSLVSRKRSSSSLPNLGGQSPARTGGHAAKGRAASFDNSDDMSSLGGGGVDDYDDFGDEDAADDDRDGQSSVVSRASAISASVLSRQRSGTEPPRSGTATGMLARMTLALKQPQPKRPSGLTRQERLLWETIVKLLDEAKAGAGNTSDGTCTEPLSNDTSSLRDPSLDQLALVVSSSQKPHGADGASAVRERLALQERDHLRSLRAIQRVLADVTAERDQALQKCRSLERIVATTASPPSDESLQPPVNSSQTGGSVSTMNAETPTALNGNSSGRILHQLPNESSRAITDPATGSISNAVSKLSKELDEKALALENAKMIITSLEKASGSLASDLRGKLKAKDDIIATLTVDVADKQKKLDSLATQLRDLQRTMPSNRNITSSNSSLAHQKSAAVDDDATSRLALCNRLEKNIADLTKQASSIGSVNGNIFLVKDKIAKLLANSISVLNASLQILAEAPVSPPLESSSFESETSSVRSQGANPVNPMPSDPRRLHRELEEKTRQLHRLEEALQKQKDATQRLEAEMKNWRNSDEEVDGMRREIMNLREQCQTNMAVLTKKERELAVLRDSLKVDDEEVGYISDDASEASESDNGGLVPTEQSLALVKYGPPQAEALATLLAHGGKLTSEIQQGAIIKEMRVLYDELNAARMEVSKCQKELRVETESLANAKMIISSLEKANKLMMEEHRSRLQDSNTAIASLLEKSMESDKATAALRQEVERIRGEKTREAENYELELKRLRARLQYSSDSRVSGTVAKDSRSNLFSESMFGTPMETID